MTSPLRLAVLGAGGRGADAYGRWVRAHPDRARVVAVADPLPARLDALAGTTAARYADWRGLVADAPRLRPDAVLVALPDALHVEAATAVAEAGLPMLLEKPAAPTLPALTGLAAVVRRTGARVAVGHVLRFAPFWRAVRAVVASGALGDLATIEVRENIGFWHFAHSYVRGSWRSTAESSPMVLAKTCHDLDLVRWLAGAPPDQVSSQGSLLHFRAENAPEGAPGRCTDGCPAADRCPFYAPRYYVDALRDVTGHPVTMLGDDLSPAGRLAALRRGPYGRCVYRCDNDVADHQQTLMTFASGLTATLTASAFTAENTRHVAITGTRGQLHGHMGSGEIGVDLYSPAARLPGELARVPGVELTGSGVDGPLRHPSYTLVARGDTVAADHRGHAGGDDALMDAFCRAVAEGTVGTGELSFATALDSHLMAFAAEESRTGAGVVDFAAWARTALGAV
ncbi:Gfo/Idh/MocA family protein [Promicromonospora thailandica]|uniref:Oxidoreductase family, C-terminal alpha/beta domain n=1 Tax=Promicromonospora thailandica TaxID=765201 RepID=A0A9X2G1I1_9MICO|nr:Gfo/Idh/MocA family oxidoreductase [Promicromonospora thailandica]MCP2265330.1 Oxidoreductase family, C-terminal alpha/beta domain [Promicromonospora thailandica]BFF16862.1 Gfo/Idh/MocA family oxidoreductase [Promicromonospora thailandica]